MVVAYCGQRLALWPQWECYWMHLRVYMQSTPLQSSEPRAWTGTWDSCFIRLPTVPRAAAPNCMTPSVCSVSLAVSPACSSCMLTSITMFRHAQPASLCAGPANRTGKWLRHISAATDHRPARGCACTARIGLSLLSDYYIGYHGRLMRIHNTWCIKWHHYQWHSLTQKDSVPLETFMSPQL